HEKSNPQWRTDLIENCRKIISLEFANYRVHYELDKKSRLKGEPSVPLNSKNIDWTEFQIQETLKGFQNITKGRIIYEENVGNVTHAVYRVTKEDLLLEVQKIELPLEFD